MNKPHKPSLAWINPLIHPVYEGWLAFFAQEYDLEIFSWTGISTQDKRHKTQALRHLFTIDILNTSFEFFKLPNVKPGSIRIVGDIYTNALSWILRGKKTVCYTEFFLSDKKQRLFFWLSAPLFWKRKFIVPSRHAKKTISSLTSKVFYLPQLYAKEIQPNSTLAKPRMKVLFVGLMDDWKKNVAWMLDELKDADCDVTLCGRNTGKLDLSVAQKRYGNRLTILPPVDHTKISSVYLAHNVFVLPSLVDPIGAVTLEAMAHSLPIIVSSRAGSSSYIEDGKNGIIIDPAKEGSLRRAIKQLTPHIRAEMGEASAELVRENHLVSNKKLMTDLHTRFERFLSE